MQFTRFAQDNLAGTDRYGEYELNPMGRRTFTVPFAGLAWTEVPLDTYSPS